MWQICLGRSTVICQMLALATLCRQLMRARGSHTWSSLVFRMRSGPWSVLLLASVVVDSFRNCGETMARKPEVLSQLKTLIERTWALQTWRNSYGGPRETGWLPFERDVWMAPSRCERLTSTFAVAELTMKCLRRSCRKWSQTMQGRREDTIDKSAIGSKKSSCITSWASSPTQPMRCWTSELRWHWRGIFKSWRTWKIRCALCIRGPWSLVAQNQQIIGDRCSTVLVESSSVLFLFHSLYQKPVLCVCFMTKLVSGIEARFGFALIQTSFVFKCKSLYSCAN